MNYCCDERLKLVEECIAETDRLQRKLRILRDELRLAKKDDFFWVGSANASVKRARIDHYKLLRRLA